MIKLSIIGLFYNQYNNYKKIINSITMSNISDYELIIVDDGSSYSEFEKLSNLIKDNPKIKIIRMSNNTRNQSKCRNIGIKLSQGEYITYIDGDDYYIPSGLYEVYKNLKDKDYYLTTVLTQNTHEDSYQARNVGIQNTSPSICIAQIIAKRKHIVDNKIFWDEEKYYWDAEDLYYGIKLLCSSDNYDVIKEPFYMHKKYKSSNSDRTGLEYKKYTEYLLEMNDDVYEFAKGNKFYGIFYEIVSSTVSHMVMTNAQ